MATQSTILKVRFLVAVDDEGHHPLYVHRDVENGYLYAADFQEADLHQDWWYAYTEENEPPSDRPLLAIQGVEKHPVEPPQLIPNYIGTRVSTSSDGKSRVSMCAEVDPEHAFMDKLGHWISLTTTSTPPLFKMISPMDKQHDMVALAKGVPPRQLALIPAGDAPEYTYTHFKWVPVEP